MNSILEKYKKDNSLLEKYQSKRQEPTILDNKGVSNQANPIYTYNQEQQYENILPDITNEEGQIIEEDADVFTKIIKTVASAGADVLYGASKGVEGIIDAGGILISKLDKGDTITDFVEKDWTKELLGDVKTSAHKDSFYSEDSIVSDVLVNVGQMLPSIALNVATGGTAGTIAFGLSAGGSGAEQALQEGATKDEAILYGTINGAVETAIEMLSGGLGGLGKGQITKLMPNLSMKMAKSTATKVLVNMAGEGVEEMVSELLQPLMKSIYKDDALEEYKSDEFVGNVLQAGLNGALCSAVIMGGNVALTSKGSRVASNVVELQEEMIKQVEEGNLEQANELANEINSKTTEFSSEIEKELSKKGTTINEVLEQNELSEVSRLQSEIRDKNLKESKKEKISSRLSNLETNISEKVQRMNVEERKKYINRTAQNYKYNKDGSFKKSYLNADAETKAKQDYASEMIRNLNKITSSNFGLNFTNRKSVNGYIKGNVITLSNSLNNEELWKQAYAKTTGHELTHTAEGKNLYDLVFTNYFEKQANNEEFKKEFDAKKNLYLNSNEKGLDAFKKMSAEKQDEYIKQEMFADVFGDMLSDKSLARKLVGDNRNTLKKLIDFFKERKENLDKFKGNKKLLKEYKKAINESFNIFTSLLKESENANNKKQKLSLKGEENEFRRLQEESREEFAKSSEQRIYAKNNERLQRRLSEIFKRRLDSRGYNSSSNRILHLKDFNLYENIDGDLFHDIFEIARNYTENGELVDLHDDYKDSICYLSDDGLSGFAITNDGDLISVFNCGRKRGFLSNISQIVKEKAKTLDCYASVNQDLQKMYNLIFDFKTASLMDYNMEYDHDNIAKNHNMPKVAFMVNTNKKVETKFFDKDSYDEAKEYQMSFFKTKYSLKDNDIRYAIKSPTLSKVKTVTTQVNQNKINAFKKGTEQAKIALIDSMAGVNNIIKLYTENKDNYEVKANLLRGFKNRADYSLQNGIRNLKGDKVLSKSYDEIFNWMDTEEKRTEYYDYLLHNHNVDRMNLFKKVTANDIQKLNFLTDYKKAKMIKKITDSKQESLSIEEFKSFMTEKQFNEFKEVFRDSKPVFGNDVTAQDSLDIISEYDKKYPEFKEHAKDVWQFADALNRLRLEAGLIDVNQYREMASIYPHYVPTEREIQSTLLSKSIAGSAKNVSTGVKKAKGSDILIKPLHEQFASQLKRVYKNIAVNEMAKDIYNAKMNSKYKDTNQDVRIVEQIKIRKTVDEYTEEDLGEKGNVVSFYKDGERISMEVTNEILEGFNTLSSVNDFSNNLILKPINKANKLFKAFTTEYNPFFIIRNFSRDIQDALLYSKNGIKSLSKNMPKAFQEILKNGEIWQRYCAMGGLYSSFFDFNNGIIVNKPLSKPNRLNPKNALSKVKNKIARANMIVEQSVRIAEFISSLENGKSYEEAFYDAQEITVNFGRSGKATRFLNSTIMPFLNAQVQGFVKLYRTIFSRKTLRELSSLLARAILIGLTPSLFNYIVYYDDDEYQGLSDYYRDNNYLIKIGDKFVKIPKGRVVTVLSSALTKSADYLLKGDKTAFEGYGETVSQAVSPVNDFRTILSPINDVKTNTTWYGGQIESSKYDNVRPSDRYDESTSAISKALGKVFNYSPKKIDYLIDQYSGVIGDVLIPATNSDGKTNALTFVSSNLTVDPVYKTKYYQDFSKKLTKLQYLKSDGDAVATLQVKYMNKVKSKISELYDEQRKIEEDTSLSKNEKDQQLKTIQLLINNMYKTAYENVDALGSNLNQLQLSEDSIDDDYYYGLYLTFGAETALKFHSTKLYEKASNLVGNSSLTYDDFFFTYFDCKGMKKSEAKAYIQSLPMSKSNKQKLFESLF